MNLQCKLFENKFKSKGTAQLCWSPCRTMRAAVNELGSCSGHLLLAWFLGPEAFSEVAARGITLTGSHRASVAAVAEGMADFAAIGQSNHSHVPSLIQGDR